MHSAQGNLHMRNNESTVHMQHHSRGAITGTHDLSCLAIELGNTVCTYHFSRISCVVLGSVIHPITFVRKRSFLQHWQKALIYCSLGACKTYCGHFTARTCSSCTASTAGCTTRLPSATPSMQDHLACKYSCTDSSQWCGRCMMPGAHLPSSMERMRSPAWM